MNQEISYNIASDLLKIGAIKFNFKEPFIWTSGIKSPIYCDNRQSLSYVDLRNMIRDAYVDIVKKHFPDAEVIAGVTTGGIPQGALIANSLNLSFIYVRDKNKDCGLKKSTEGYLKKGQKVVIIEDNVSTGKSSIKVLEQLRNEGAEVLGMITTLSYELPEAEENFRLQNCKVYTLSSFKILIETAVEGGYLTEEEVTELYKWHKNPQSYNFDSK